MVICLKSKWDGTFRRFSTLGAGSILSIKERKCMKRVAKFLIILVIIVVSVIILKKDDELIVCIDPGHGGIDVGAVNGERYEKNDNFNIAKLVEKYLNEQGIKTITTRDNDRSVSLRQRCKIANRKKADFFISLHRNSADSGNGIEIWIDSKEKSKDISLAESILNKLQNTEIQSNRGVKSGTAKGENTDYYVLKNTNMTSCLIELGFISDDKDNKLFDKYIQDYAKAIANGVIEEIKDE